MSPVPLRFALLLALLLLAAPPLAAGEALVGVRGADLRIDGRLDEADWARATRLPCEAVHVPRPPPVGGMVRLQPDLRLLAAGEGLVVGLRLAEDPGTAIGVHVFVAPPGAERAADALAVGYRPLELRAPRYSVRGPEGAGRSVYPVRGATAFGEAGRWSLELVVPLAALLGETREAALQLAAVVFTRTPNVGADAPAGARWRGPAHWLTLEPPAGGWPTDDAVDRAAVEAEDDADAARLRAWRDYQRGSGQPPRPPATAASMRAHVATRLLEPLATIVRLQPALRVPVLCLRGDLHHRLGDQARAQADFAACLDLSPGWREARYGLHLRVRALALSEGALGGPSDYAAALERIAVARAAAAKDPWALDGLDLARGLLLYKQGVFEEARILLDRMAARYPHDAYIVEHARLARRYGDAWASERTRREQEAAGDLPHAFLETSRGTIELLLFDEDAPNTVSNFVWLSRRGFYDGLAFHRSVPFFLVQGGDPFTRTPDGSPEQVGTGTPGYAIRTEASGRRPYRGVIAMAQAGRDTAGSQFFLTTGTAAHLEGEQTVFGRIVTGWDVLDRLQQGDTVRGVRFAGLDPERAYRPTTVAGRPAPK